MPNQSKNFEPLPPNGSLTQTFLAWEDQIIKTIKDGSQTPEIWACWQSAQGLCVTRKEHRLENFISAQDWLIAQGEELATRRSGGTIVPQGDGILNITHIAVQTGPRNISKSYRAFCQSLQFWLKTFGFETEIGPVSGSYCDGDYNIVLDGKKLAGTSQRWVKGPNNHFIALNHAVILITETGQKATQRVNDFLSIANQTQPYNLKTSLSLWESIQNKTSLDKQQFFNKVIESFNPNTMSK